MDGDEIIELMKVLLIFLVSMLYCYFIASKLPKGKFRLLSLLPIFSLYVFLPLYFSSFFFRSVATFIVTWLTTLKLLLFSFDSGPLASDPPLSFPLFVSLAFFPARTSHNKKTPSAQNAPKELSQEPPLKWPLKFAILLLIPIVSIQLTLMYFTLNLGLTLSNAFVQLAFGIEVKRPFNEPYLATSLQNYWGRRWNLLISDILHCAVYEPVRYRMGSPRWVAVIAVFTVSGLMHELLYYHTTKQNPTWAPTLFFVIHGVCVAVEIELNRMLGTKRGLHLTMSRLLTLMFILVTTNWLMIPSLLRMGNKISSTTLTIASLYF